MGVILNLSLWFGLHVLFDVVSQQPFGPLNLWLPDFSTLNPVAAALTVLCAVLLLWRHWALGWVLLTSAALAVAASVVI